MEEACKHEQTFEFHVMAGDGDFSLRIYVEGHAGTARFGAPSLSASGAFRGCKADMPMKQVKFSEEVLVDFS